MRYLCLKACVGLLCLAMPLSGFAKFKTYVIDTYGNPSLADVIQNELDTRQGGTIAFYQGKLIIRATPEDFASIEPIIAKLDTAPTSLLLSLAIADTAEQLQRSHALNVGIQRRVWVNGHYQSTHTTNQTQNHYSVRTLAGHEVAIGKNTLIGLGLYGTYPTLYVGTTWLSLSEGLVATPRLLPNGQVHISLTAQQAGQFVNTTLTTQKGVWTKLGDISNDKRHAQGGFGQYSQQTTALWARIDGI